MGLDVSTPDVPFHELPLVPETVQLETELAFHVITTVFPVKTDVREAEIDALTSVALFSLSPLALVHPVSAG